MSKEYGPAPLERWEPIGRNLRRDHWRKAGPLYQVFWKKNGKPDRENLPEGIGIREAEKRRDEIMVRVHGTAVGRATTFDRSRTVNDLKDIYWADHAPDNTNVVIEERWSDATLRKYDGNWKNYIGGNPKTGRLKDGRQRPFLPEHLKLVDVHPDVHLEPMLAYMSQHLGVKAKGIAWGIVTGMFEYAVELEWMRPAENPCGMVRKQVKPKARKRSKQEKRALAEAKLIHEPELRSIISAFRRPADRHWQDVIRTGAKLGLRPSESLGFCVDQIEDGYVCVDRQLAERFTASDPTTWLAPAKNEYGDEQGRFIKGNGRRIPIKGKEDIVKLLAALRLAASPSTLHPDGYQLLFTTSKGTPYVQTEYNDKWRWALDQVDLKSKVGVWVPHCLRHTYATQRFLQGGSVDDVAEELGDDPETVRATYIHLVDKSTREEIAAEQYRRSFLAAL